MINSRRNVGIVALGIASILLVSALTMARTTADTANMEKLYGSWSIEVTASELDFPALITFGAEGAVITDRPPVRGETSGHGNWLSQDDGVAYTFVSLFSSDDAGTYRGHTTTIGTLEYEAETDRWLGPFRFDGFNAEGGLDVSRTGTFVLTRIAVEPMD